jgi:DNA polymerase III subunit delta
MTSGPVIFIKGDDPVLVAEALKAASVAALNGEEAEFALADFSTEDYEIASLVDAAQTPPMFSVRRVVVARAVGRFASADLEPLLDYLAGPLETTTLILVAGGGQTSRKLLDAVKKKGVTIDAGVPAGKGRQQWLSARLAEGPVRLDARAQQKLAEHLGDDLGRLNGILEVLSAVYGLGARVNADDIEPYLGSAGSGAPWDLTDAIDRGDAAGALDQLHRMVGAGERHPLQVMSTLQGHVGKMLRLDGSGARDEVEAAAHLGMNGSTFPAKKALTQARKLGSAGIARAVHILADADLDLRGRRDLPGDLVLELAVARLARLSGPAARR